MQSNKKIVPCLAIFFLIAVIVLLLNRFFAIEDRLIVAVDGFRLDKVKDITIGYNSDVCYDRIPNDYMSVSFADTAVTWEINQKYRNSDSLCYYKINNINPNIHTLEDGDIVTIVIAGQPYKISSDSIQSLLKDVDNEYIPLRFLFAKANPSLTNMFLQAKLTRSFVYRKNNKKHIGCIKLGSMGPLQLVILDKNVSITHADTTIRYCWNGSIKDFDSNCNSFDELKVQFFDIESYFFGEEASSDSQFRIGEKCYVSKVWPILTSWGAGHIMFRREKNVTNAYFPKAAMYVDTKTELEDLANRCSQSITFRQQDNSFPIAGVLSFPAFSRHVPEDICNISVTDSGYYCGGTLLSSSLGMTPMVNSVISKTNPNIKVRIGILDWRYWLSYIIPILIIWLILLFFMPCLFNPSGSNRFDWDKDGVQRKCYFRIVLLIAFVFMLCRVMIAAKLSYTYPFFDKLTGVIVSSCCLMLLLIYNIALLTNYEIIGVSVENRPRNAKVWIPRNWWVLILSLVLFVFCCFILGESDRCTSNPVVESYFYDSVHTEVITLRNFVRNLDIWNWSDMAGMNDIHRNVPFTLLWMNLLLMIFLLLRNLLSLIMKNKKAHITKKNTKKNKKVTPWIRELFKYVVSIFFFLVASLLGNSGTALITSIVIFVLGMSIVNGIDSAVKGKKRIIYPIISGFIILVLAVVLGGDMGYFINCLSVIFLLLLLLAFTVRNNGEQGFQKEEHKATKKDVYWTAGVLLLCLVVAGWYGYTKIDADKATSSRMDKRIIYCVNNDAFTGTGYRYAVRDAEFMMVLTHPMFNCNFSDPLSPDDHPMHPSVSTGQSPVVLNDVSAPIAFFGSYGTVAMHLVLICIMLVMACSVWYFSIRDKRHIPVKVAYRILAMSMWIGATVYLLLSYWQIIPFTGRLIPGLGVDSVGEAIESSVLLAFMLATPLLCDKRS